MAALFDDGRLAGAAEFAGLGRAFGRLQTFGAWLAGSGGPLLAAALAADKASPA